jgi:hypothetical protein
MTGPTCYRAKRLVLDELPAVWATRVSYGRYDDNDFCGPTIGFLPDLRYGTIPLGKSARTVTDNPRRLCE